MTNDWQIIYHNIPTGVKSYGQEAILTLGNGYLGLRGAPIISRFSDDHYPGLYVAGIFNQTTTKISDHDVINEDLVNFPNPQLLEITIDGKKLTTPYSKRESTLNMQNGTLNEKFVFPVAKGNLFLTTTKVVDPINYHQFGVEADLSSNFTAQIQVEFIIDGTVLNQNVARYRNFNSQEFEIVNSDDHILSGRTLQSKINFAIGAKTETNVSKIITNNSETKVFDQAEFTIQPQQTVTLKRVMAVATDNDTADYFDVVDEAISHSSFDDIYQSSCGHWQKFWQESDVKLVSDDTDAQKMIHLNIFQLHQAVQGPVNSHLDASIGSRGLTGEGYRGHIFWDELFIVPYLATNDPDAAKAIIQYRIKRLSAAKQNANAQLEKGAMYPWQSASIGDEQAQFIHLNPISNQWYPDNSRLQRHVSLAVVYDLWSYTDITGKTDLLLDGGLNLLLETSKFWLNKAQFDGQNYHISGVMGPDEFHEAYPDTETGGLSDNAYTNLMVVWSLLWMLKLQKQLPEAFNIALQECDFDQSLINKAHELIKYLKIYVNDDGVIEQYNHYFELKDLDLKAYQDKYQDIHRIDRILTSEGKSCDDYQVDKQADVLMTTYNFGQEVVQSLCQSLGIKLPKDWLLKNRDYYLARTVHGSTVSRPVYATVDVALGDINDAWNKLKVALKSDYDDIQGGTTADGIHTGVMGSTLTVIMRDFAGIRLVDDVVVINPQIPKQWQELSFNKIYRGIKYHFLFQNGHLTVSADHDTQVQFHNKTIELSADQAVKIQ